MTQRAFQGIVIYFQGSTVIDLLRPWDKQIPWSSSDD